MWHQFNDLKEVKAEAEFAENNIQKLGAQIKLKVQKVKQLEAPKHVDQT